MPVWARHSQKIYFGIFPQIPYGTPNHLGSTQNDNPLVYFRFQVAHNVFLDVTGVRLSQTPVKKAISGILSQTPHGTSEHLDNTQNDISVLYFGLQVAENLFLDVTGARLSQTQVKKAILGPPP